MSEVYTNFFNAFVAVLPSGWAEHNDGEPVQDE